MVRFVPLSFRFGVIAVTLDRAPSSVVTAVDTSSKFTEPFTQFEHNATAVESNPTDEESKIQDVLPRFYFSDSCLLNSLHIYTALTYTHERGQTHAHSHARIDWQCFDDALFTSDQFLTQGPSWQKPVTQPQQQHQRYGKGGVYICF